MNAKYGMKIKSHDKNPCMWSHQADGKCKELNLMKDYVDYFGISSQRCSGKKCLIIDQPKPFGPRNSDFLLSNVNIESILSDFEKAANKGLFKHSPAKHLRFEMADFMNCNDSDLKNIHKYDHKYYYCVLNTDIWSGGGKHWVCIFAEKKNNRLFVEYFNSSGNGLKRLSYYKDGQEKYTLCEWKKHIESHGIEVSIKEVVNFVLQKSRTECGVWCLWYIKNRLEGETPEEFFRQNLTDSDMLERARKMLFSG